MTHDVFENTANCSSAISPIDGLITIKSQHLKFVKISCPLPNLSSLATYLGLDALLSNAMFSKSIATVNEKLI